jgi:CRP/FNR family transcriptional regulator
MIINSIDIPQSCSLCQNKSNLFCCLTIDEKENLSENKGSNFYKKGQSIFYEGNQSHGLFCIYKGKVKLSKLGENGKDQVVRFAKSGDVVGYRSLFSNEPYQATATAMEDTYVCHLSADGFMKLITANPKLSWEAMKLLSKDLKNAEQHLINITQKTVKERIAEALLILYKTFGFTENNLTLDISLTRAEIGDIAGTTTETTIRTLAQLKKEGVIELNGKSISIPNINKLMNIAAIYD